MAGFFEASLDPSQPDSYDSIARKRRLAEAMMKQGTDTSPIQHWTQGLARMAQAWVAGDANREADAKEKEGNDAFKSLLVNALGGGSTASPSAPAPGPTADAPGSSLPAMGISPVVAPETLRPHFEAASKATGIPVEVLIAQAKQESQLNPSAVGKAGEIGLTQIMPSTARDPGFGVAGVDPASLRDPAKNAMFGAQYLAGRAKAAGVTDWNDPRQIAKALAAYNGGGDPNYAQNVMRYMPAARAISRAAPNPDLPSPGAQEVGGAPLPPGAEAFANGPDPRASIINAMLSGTPGRPDYTLGSRGFNGNNNGLGMTEIPTGALGPMSARTGRMAGGGTETALTPSPMTMGTLPPGIPATADPRSIPVAQASPAGGSALGGNIPQSGGSALTPEMLQAFAQRGGNITPEMLQAYARRNGMMPADPTGGATLSNPDLPSPNAAPAGPAPMPQDPVLAATAARAQNPQPGDQFAPLGSAQEQAFTRLEGQPGAAPQTAATPAGVDRGKMLLMAALDPRLSPQQRQSAMQMATMLQGQDKTTYQTDGEGNIIALDPSGRRPPQVVYKAAVKPMTMKEGERLVSPTDGRVIAGEGGSKLERDVAERKAQAVKMGLDPNDPRARQYILTGNYPKDPELTAGDKTAILESDELVSQNRSLIGNLQQAKELSKKAADGWVGNAVSGIGAQLGNETAKNTVELNNLVTTNALSSLKTIFGGNPTEGERKILLDIQGAGSQPDAIRQKIFDRAIEAAKRRLQFNEEKAKSLRGGTYYKPPGGAGQAAPQAPLADPLGIR